MRAVGVIETKGLAAALEAADAAVKSANVTLLGYELSRGAGQVTVKMEGDISAVTAAVEAGAQAASAVNQVVATLIMGRPHDDVRPLIYSPFMVGLPEEPQEEAAPVPAEPKEPAGTEEPKPSEQAEATCNLCHDPACPRSRGEPRVNCIHYNP